MTVYPSLCGLGANFPDVRYQVKDKAGVIARSSWWCVELDLHSVCVLHGAITCHLPFARVWVGRSVRKAHAASVKVPTELSANFSSHPLFEMPRAANGKDDTEALPDR